MLRAVCKLVSNLLMVCDSMINDKRYIMINDYALKFHWYLKYSCHDNSVISYEAYVHVIGDDSSI